MGFIAILRVLRLGKAWAARHCVNYQIPYRTVWRGKNNEYCLQSKYQELYISYLPYLTVPYPTVNCGEMPPWGLWKHKLKKPPPGASLRARGQHSILFWSTHPPRVILASGGHLAPVYGQYWCMWRKRELSVSLRRVRFRSTLSNINKRLLPIQTRRPCLLGDNVGFQQTFPSWLPAVWLFLVYRRR